MWSKFKVYVCADYLYVVVCYRCAVSILLTSSFSKHLFCNTSYLCIFGLCLNTLFNFDSFNFLTKLLILVLQGPSGFLVHPSGVEKPLHDCVNELRQCYGDKQGKQFRVWVDQVLPAQIGSDTWLVKFKKWEQSGEIHFLTSYSFFSPPPAVFCSTPLIYLTS